MEYELAVKLGVTLAYFLVLILIGVITSRLINNIEDYFVAGKGLGYWLVSFSSRASGESGWLILGLTGMGFTLGLHAFWITLGEVLGVMIAWLFLVQRFKLLTDKYDSITIPDYLEDRFHDIHYVLRIASAIVLSVFVTMYVSGQYLAAGKAFKGFLGIDVTTGIILGTLIVIIYSVAGGFVAVVWSDLIQGIFMFLGLTLVPVTALFMLGGPEPLFTALRSIDPVLLTISGSSSAWGIKTIFGILGLVSIGWGFLGSPQLFVRFIAIKDNEELVNGSLVAVLFTICTDAGAVISGMCGRVLYENLDWMTMFYGRVDSEMVYPMLVEDLFPLWISAFFLAVVLAAIMSTADSLLVVASSAVVRDIYQKIWRPDASQRWLTWMSRGLTLALALAALWFTIWFGTSKFTVQRRNIPLNQLNQAANVPLDLGQSRADLSRLDAHGITNRWLPSVEQGLNELGENLKLDKNQFRQARVNQIRDLKAIDISPEKTVLTAENPTWSVRQSASRLYEEINQEITLIDSLLKFREDSDLPETYREHLAAMPVTTGTGDDIEFQYPDEPVTAEQWNQWFYNYRIIREDLVNYLENNRTGILRSFDETRSKLNKKLLTVNETFRDRKPEWAGLTSEESIPRQAIQQFQARLGELHALAKSFYPQNLLELDRQPAVFWFILIGWAGIASAFCPVIILSLYWENMTKWGAFAGLLSGFVVVTFWVFYPMDQLLQIPGVWEALSGLGFNPHGLGSPNDIIYEMVPGFFFSFLSIFVVSLLTSAKDQSRDDLEDIRQQSVDLWELPNHE